MSRLFDHNGAEGKGYSQPAPLLPATELDLPSNMARKELPRWPRLSEPEMVRHYTWLSKRNFGIDTGFYPLGSCTMKHNPRANEVVAQLPGIADIHPHQPEHQLQGLLSIFYEMQDMLAICAGMDAVTLQPVAGAQGEFTAVRCFQEYFRHRGEHHRTKVIVPDSAHGTNPASAAMAGFEIIEIPSQEDGRIDLSALRAVVGDDTVAMMITNPNTLGLFEQDIAEASEIVHNVGGLMYYDGANFNAILGRTSPGLMGFDAVHYNLHKTFSQPHGGGVQIWSNRCQGTSRTLLALADCCTRRTPTASEKIRLLTSTGTHGLCLSIRLERFSNGMEMQGLFYDVGLTTADTVRNFEQCRSMLFLMRTICVMQFIVKRKRWC